jgi:hypothetical protein
MSMQDETRRNVQRTADSIQQQFVAPRSVHQQVQDVFAQRLSVCVAHERWGNFVVVSEEPFTTDEAKIGISVIVAKQSDGSGASGAVLLQKENG